LSHFTHLPGGVRPLSNILADWFQESYPKQYFLARPLNGYFM